MPLARPVSSADVRPLASGSLPAAPAPPGRATTNGTAALGLKLAVERNAYVAGQQVKGVLELSVKGQLALGEVGIEFLGVEGESQHAGFSLSAPGSGRGRTRTWVRHWNLSGQSGSHG